MNSGKVIMMKKILGIIVICLLCCSIGYAKTKITEIKRSVKEDRDGLLKLKEFHALNAPHAINPVSVSDFSIIGKTSIRFEMMENVDRNQTGMIVLMIEKELN